MPVSLDESIRGTDLEPQVVPKCGVHLRESGSRRPAGASREAGELKSEIPYHFWGDHTSRQGN